MASVQSYRTKSHVKRWAVRYKDPETGRHRSETYSSEKLANTRKREIEDALERGTLQGQETAEDMTVNDVLVWWFQAQVKAKKPRNSLITYKSAINKRIAPYIGQASLHTLLVRSTVLNDWQGRLLDEGVGDSMRRKALATLSTALSDAVEEGWIERNPCKGRRWPSEPESKRKGHALTPEQAIALLHELGKQPEGEGQRPPTSLQRLRTQMIAAVLLQTGVRPGELLGLQWGDIGERSILIARAVNLDGQARTKTGRERVVLLTKTLAADLDLWAEASESERHRRDWVFPSLVADDKYWTVYGYQGWRKRVWEPAVARLAQRGKDWEWIADADPYVLRHTHDSLSLLGGAVDLATQAARSGHDALTMSRTYMHAYNEGEAREGKETLEAMLNRARNEAGFAYVEVETAGE